jgi:copper chaperone CopZ
MSKVSLSVPNINCNHCVQTIETELSELDGVVSVEANSVTKEVNIDYVDPANEEGIKILLAEINYPVID